MPCSALDTMLRNLKPKDKFYKVNDRDGPYVVITPVGSISFRYNYSIHDRQETITFGRYGVEGSPLRKPVNGWTRPRASATAPMTVSPSATTGAASLSVLVSANRITTLLRMTNGINAATAAFCCR